MVLGTGWLRSALQVIGEPPHTRLCRQLRLKAHWPLSAPRKHLHLFLCPELPSPPSSYGRGFLFRSQGNHFLPEASQGAHPLSWVCCRTSHLSQEKAGM